jgi:hypothetical protein
MWQAIVWLLTVQRLNSVLPLTMVFNDSRPRALAESPGWSWSGGWRT